MSLFTQLKYISNAFVDVIYPNNCAICSTHLTHKESYLCLSCKFDLPYIKQSQSNVESLEKLFWGRVEVKHIFALLNYQKGNQTQTLLHQLKYNNKTKLAEHFGDLLGEIFKSKIKFDYLIPVPLHPKKLKLRGFNQSAVIANGINLATNIPIMEKVIKRNTFNTSQTIHSKYDRWDNVKSIFTITKPRQLEHKHIVIVDDVLTTGATIEACVKEFLKIEGCKVSIAVLAARI